MIWKEYSEKGGLGQRERETDGGWRSTWSKADRNLFFRKQMVCRAIARHARPPSTVETALETALASVQAQMKMHRTFSKFVDSLQLLEKDARVKDSGKRLLARMF